VLRGKVALDTQRLAPGLSKRCRGRDYRLKSARFSNEQEHKEQWANPMLSTSLILRGQAERRSVDYDLSRSEDNRPRAKPRPARDKLKRASVEPVSEPGRLICRRTGIWSMTTIFIFFILLLLLLLILFLSCLLFPWRSRYMQSRCHDGTRAKFLVFHRGLGIYVVPFCRI
jgi:hypothetical protein